MIILKFILTILAVKVTICVEMNSFDTMFKEANPISYKCITNVVKNHFPCGTPISIVNTRGDVDELVQTLSNDSCYSLIVRRYRNQDWLLSTKLYILIARDGHHFSSGMSRLTSDIFWNPASQVIIELEKAEEKDITTVFDVLLRYNIFSAILLRKVSEQEVTVYTYYPFNNTNCGLKYEYAKIGNCEDISKTKFFIKEPIRLRNCNVTVVANKELSNFIFEEDFFTEDGNKLPSLEQYLLEIIGQKEGIDIQYNLVMRELGLGVVLPNNTATGLLSFLQRDEVDIAAGGIILIKNRMDMFDFIWGYDYASFNLYTPGVGEEIWKDVYKEFSVTTWLLIVLAYCTVTAISLLVRRWKFGFINHHAFLSLKLWGYLYTNTCKNLSKDKKMRIIMVFWIWFTFFVCNFYNTALYSLLTSRHQIKRHITVDDLHQLDFEPCISDSTRTYFKFSVNKSLPVGRNLPQCNYSDTALAYAASSKNAYAIELEYIYTLNEDKYLDDDGNSQLDTWSFSTSNVIVMYLTKGFPMTREFQDYSWRLYESGILEQHLKKLHRSNRTIVHTHKRHFKKILLADLRIHFLVLFTGILLSVICFILEITWFRK